jgi:hypothetical protein
MVESIEIGWNFGDSVVAEYEGCETFTGKKGARQDYPFMVFFARECLMAKREVSNIL